MNQTVQRMGLSLARFALSAWVGAAILFVIDGVRLVTSDAFDSTGRDNIALIRFPLYYAMGAVCLTIAVGSLAAARGVVGMSGRRWTAILLLTLIAACVMLGDYVWVYLPLSRMITPPGATRPESFQTLHQASEAVNTIHIGLCLLAVGLCNWPLSLRASLPSDSRGG
ncbi:MAG: hypothetical protein KF861_04485 [Planctomycetaceae bacterium]|nr:hypothetical protein [Planctomycetaceae bacterium]